MYKRLGKLIALICALSFLLAPSALAVPDDNGQIDNQIPEIGESENPEISEGIEIEETESPEPETAEPAPEQGAEGKTEEIEKETEEGAPATDTPEQSEDSEPPVIQAVIRYESEPNNTMGDANATSIGWENRGYIGYSLDTDWWAITFPSAGTALFSLTTIPSGCDYDLDLISSGGSILRQSTNGSNSNENITYSVSATTYYLKVRGFSGSSTSSYYTLIASHSPTTPSGDQYEPNDTWAGAKTVSIGSTINATLHTTSDEDFFRVVTSDSYALTFRLYNIPSGSNFNLNVYDYQGNFVAGSYSGIDQEDSVTIQVQSGEGYHVRVNYAQGPTGAYKLSTSTAYGSRPYQHMQNDVFNCMGYAIESNLPFTAAYLGLDQYGEMNGKDLNGLLNFTFNKSKEKMSNLNIAYSEISRYNSSVGSNCFRAVLRVGFVDSDKNGVFSYDSDSGWYEVYDYHWWYQTSSGQWAQKFSFTSTIPSQLTSVYGGENPCANVWLDVAGTTFYNSSPKYFSIVDSRQYNQYILN